MSAMTGDSGPLRDREEKQMVDDDEVRDDVLDWQEVMRVERVLRDLTRPMFVWRMAKAKMYGREATPRRRGAEKSYARAMGEIHGILEKYRAGGYDEPRIYLG